MSRFSFPPVEAYAAAAAAAAASSSARLRDGDPRMDTARGGSGVVGVGVGAGPSSTASGSVHSQQHSPQNSDGTSTTSSRPSSNEIIEAHDAKLAALTKRNGRFDEMDVAVDSSTGALLSASAEALIRRLLPGVRSSPADVTYIFAVLLNMRTYMAPAEMLQKIVQHCLFEQHATAENFKRDGRARMFAHVIRLATEWVTSLPYDFRSAEMRQRLGELLALCATDRPSRERVHRLLGDLHDTLARLEQYEAALLSSGPGLETTGSSTAAPASNQLTGLAALCSDAETIARQLTLIELERFSMIGADEVVGALADGELARIGMSGAGRITHYIKWFNHVSMLVAGEVLRHQRKRHRVLTIELWIDVAKACVDVGNFNTLMAVVAGLALPPVARLKRTWERVDKQKLDILQHQLDPTGNFLAYRATLKAAVWRADGSQNEQLVIPFFVLLLKDLFLIFHGQQRILRNGQLNFKVELLAAFLPKRQEYIQVMQQIADTVRDMQRWQRKRCPFERNSSVLQYLLLTTVMTERDLMIRSFDCELPETGAEKEQLRKLRHEKHSVLRPTIVP